MKKLKKKKKRGAKKKPDEAQVRRNRLLFGACAVGVVVLLFGAIYGYTVLAERWRESKGLSQIQSDDEQVRISGMWKLARGHLTAHTPKICEMLQSDPSLNVRKSAPHALAAMNDPRALPCIAFALGDESDSVAEQAMLALQKMTRNEITWESVVDWWDAHKAEYADACDHPEGVPVVTAMKKLLEDEKYYVRLAAVKRLSVLKHAAARPLLEVAVADANEKVGQAAREALEKLSATNDQP